MQLVLALPGLLASRDAGTTPVPAPALAQLLANGGTPVRGGDEMGEALAPRYGVERQTDWPLAPIRLAAHGVDPGAAFWFAADPVTLDVGRSDVRLAGVVGDLSSAEVDALLTSLNTHFADDGVTFLAPRPDAIFVRTEKPPRLSTHPTAAAMGHPLSSLLPQGPDAGTWRRWQSEIQMLLHEHPVNVARTDSGRPAANSVWFSQGGVFPAMHGAGPSIRTFANGGIAAALAFHAGSPARALPERLDDALSETGAAELIVVALEPALELVAIERAWAVPARQALASGRLLSVTLVADGAGDALAWHARRPSLWHRLAGRLKRRDLAALLDAAKRDD